VFAPDKVTLGAAGEQTDALNEVAPSTGAAVIVIEASFDVAKQPFPAAIELVTKYVPGVLAFKSTSPVLVLTKTNPAVELNVPALVPGLKIGSALDVAY